MGGEIRRFDFMGKMNLRMVQGDDGKPLAILSDPALFLGYRDATTAGRLLKPNQVRSHEVSTAEGSRNVLAVTEGGLYRLIMRSNQPDAEVLQDWFTEEVLPQIARTGSYSKNGDSTTIETIKRNIQVMTDMVKEIEYFSGQLSSIGGEVKTIRQELDELKSRPQIHAISGPEAEEAKSKTDMVRRIVKNPLFIGKSGREIARICDVDEKIVRRVQKENVHDLRENLSATEAEESSRTLAFNQICGRLETDNYTTIRNYTERIGLRLGLTDRSHVGNRLSRLCRENGWPVQALESKEWGHVNRYPESLLRFHFLGEVDAN